MRKLVHIKWLFVAIFLVTQGACGTDELTQRTVQPASVEEERVDTIRLQLDFPTINFRSEITAVEEGQEASNLKTRASLEVQDRGVTKVNLLANGTQNMKVFLILRNRDGSKVYISDNNDWKVVESQKLSASGVYTFTQVKGAPFTWQEDEEWMLDAMMGGTWNSATKTYDINKSCMVPTKLYKKDEKMELNKDIVVPFILGTSWKGLLDNDLKRKYGVRMAVANGDREGGTAYRLICIDAEPDFVPYGSLLCMRFKNDMHKALEEIQAKYGMQFDGYYPGVTATSLLNSFVLRGVNIESTSTTLGGWINVDALGAPDRQLLPWTGCRPDGSAYTFSTANPFKQTVQLDRAVTGNMHTGYALARKKDSEADSKYTPYFYVWTKSIDESKDQASQFGGGELKISLDLYNATLDVPIGVRKAFSSVRNHKTGRAYFRDAGVGADISISASNYFAPNFVYNDRSRANIPHNDAGTIYRWPDADAKNSDMQYSSYYYHELYDNAPNRHFTYGKLRYFKDEFEVYDPPLVKGGVPRENHTKWVLPDELTVRALFPPADMKNINETNKEVYPAGALHKESPERVRIGGIIFNNMTSYYYRPLPYTRKNSIKPTNYEAFYGLRFVGTPFCYAVRYTVVGQWLANNGKTIQTLSLDDSRYVIHTRSVADYGIDWTDEEACKRFLKDVICGNLPTDPNTPPQNAFWGDFWNPDPSLGVDMRNYLVPGSGLQNAFNERVRLSAQKVFFIGQYFQFAVSDKNNPTPPSNSTPAPYVKNYKVLTGNEEHSYTFGKNVFNGFGPSLNNKPQPVLPVRAPRGLDDPQWFVTLQQQ